MANTEARNQNAIEFLEAGIEVADKPEAEIMQQAIDVLSEKGSRTELIVRWVGRQSVGYEGSDSVCYAERPKRRNDGVWCPSSDNGAISCGKILEYLGIEGIFAPGDLAKVTIEIIEPAPELKSNQGSESARQGVGPIPRAQADS